MVNLLISNFLLFANLTFFYFRLFKVKRKNIFLFFSYIVCVIISINLNLYLPMSLKTSILIILIIFYIILCFSGTIIKKLLALFPFLIIYIISELISANLLSLIMGFDATLENRSTYFLFGILLSNFFVILISTISVKLFKEYLKKDIPKYSWIILVLPITTIALILNLNNYANLLKESILFSLILLGLIFSNITIIFIFFKVVSYLEYKNKNIAMQLEDEYLKSKYTLLEQQYDQSFSFLHDILKKSINLQCLLENQDYVSLNNELNSLTLTTFKEFNMLYTNSDIINNIINSKIFILHKYEIDVKSTISYNNFSFLTFSDRVSFFSKILDFAIYACCKSIILKRVIVLKSELYNGRITIQLLYNKSEIYKSVEYINLIKYLNLMQRKYNFLYSLNTTSLINSDSIIFSFDVKS